MALDILSVVIEPTWKEFLVDLVASHQMDPWDIDISAVADAYLTKVKQMQSMDLRLPANVILACAILLKMKSETISFEEESELQEDYIEDLSSNAPGFINETIPELLFRPNMPRKRKVTLAELLEAVDDVVRDGPRQQIRINAPKELKIEIKKSDMHELMKFVYEQLASLADTQGIVLFSDLVKKGYENTQIQNTPFKENFSSVADALTLYLLPVLHLVQEQKIHAWQNEEFSDIFIKVAEQNSTEKFSLIKK